ncbi:MAG: Uma2 family endonuclease [Bryobacteraceae bacterium]
MQLTIDEAYLPVKLTATPMSDEEFAEFCTLYPDHFIEMTAEGEIVIMPPNYSFTGAQSGEIFGQLRDWASGGRRGIATDSSGGFLLPNGARLAPDAAWTLKSRIPGSSAERRRKYWKLSPDFVVELRSDTDRLPVLRAKLQEWIDNGARLAWLIDPEREAVEIYRAGQKPDVRIGIQSIAGEGPVEGFVLDLRRVWDPLAD